MQGNSGQLSYGYPLKVVPGPGGFTPQLALNYSSGDPNGRSSATSPAGEVGDGWTLSMGSISASVYPTATSLSGSSAAPGTWYFISGVANVSDRLVPNPTPRSASEPDFLTEHISQLRIQQFTPSGRAYPCFAVWDTSGTYYEFGCTPDSLQLDNASSTPTPYRWDLDEMVAPSEGATGAHKIIEVSYQQDCTVTGTPFCLNVRDSAISRVIYGYSASGTLNMGTLATIGTVVGTVDLSYAGPSYATSTCASGTTPVPNGGLRCDDPANDDVPGVFGLAAPPIMSTLTLQTVTSYVGDDSTGTRAYGYSLNYQDSPPTQVTEPLSQLLEYLAGEHLLTQVTPSIYQNGSAHPLKPLVLSYTALSTHTDTYTDTQHTISTGAIYSQSTNWQYLSQVVDLGTGMGNFITYQTAYSNTNGTPDFNGGLTTDTRLDPFYCDNRPADCTGVYAHPDDRAWSQQVVFSIVESLTNDTNASDVVATHLLYSYSLAQTGSGASCHPTTLSNFCVGDNWTPKNTTTGVGDTDWIDYNHAEYRGFNVVYTTNTAGETTVDLYYSTKGWVTGNSDASNYNAGHVYEEDVYQNANLPGQSPLSTTISQYTGTCTPGWPSCPSPTYPNSCNGAYSVVYSPCEVMVIGSLTTQQEQRLGSGTPPTVRVDSTYDDYNALASPSGSGLLSTGFHTLIQEQVTPSNATPATMKWTYTSVDSTLGSWGTYDVNKVAHSEVDDSANHQWQCQDTTYDEGTPNGLSAGWPTTLKTYQSSNCSTPGSATPLTTSYIGYDAYGNAVATVDGVGAANSGLYSSAGCSASPSILSSAWTSGHFTNCTAYDPYEAQMTGSTSAASGTVNLTTLTSYDGTQGRVPISVTDANGQATTSTYSYDSGGNSTTSVVQPGETASFTTQSHSYATCGTTSLTASTPCYQTYTLSSLYPNAISQTFYDGLGRVIQSSTPIPTPVGADASKKYFKINLTLYNDTNHSVFQYLPFVVVGSTTIGSFTGVGWIDPTGAVQDYAGNGIYGSATYDDALGRTVAFRDAAYQQGASGVLCPSLGIGATATTCAVYSYGPPSGSSTIYGTMTSIDANNHVTTTYGDALGNTRYLEYDSGVNGGTLTVNEQITTQYNVLGEPTSLTTTDLASPTGSPQSVTVTATYDDLGRLLTQNDPDQGNHTYTYDADSRVLTDVSGTRTIGFNYDLSGRLGCEQRGTPTINASGACTSGTQPLVQNIYDSSNLTITGTTDYPLGRLTKSLATTVYADSTQATTTTTSEYDRRGNTIAQQMQIGVPSTWGVTTALPTYQMTMSYSDANQLVTSQPSVGGVTAPSTTQVYDAATGVQTGLSNNTNTVTANLATLGYNSHGLLQQLNFLSSTGNTIASEQFGYDTDLRTTSSSACWSSLGCSGTNGTIFSQSIGYDPASNVTSTSTSYAPVNGVSNTGGSLTQDFCYDEQNRLVWAGDSGSVPSAGNGTCGSATLQNSLSGSSSTYSNSFVYTHLGQLYQAPINGGTTQDQYLSCNSAHPHQLSGLYPLGTTCATASTSNRVYSSSYDNWGNVTSRFFSNTTATLSYDALDRFTEWNTGSANHEWYTYDASGTRVLRRTTNGSGTTLTVYAFGEEHSYNSTGATNSGNTYYLTLGGRLIGKQSGTTSFTTQYYLEDTLGSPLATFSNASGTTTVLGNRAYGPYGNQLSSGGSMGTAKGFTGQYNDSLTGLDYYGGRYYDQKAGVFLSADSVQGNWLGMNPYGYVGGNPETHNDPSGHDFWSNLWGGVNSAAQTVASVATTVATTAVSVADSVTGFSSMVNDVGTVFNGNASLWDKLGAGADFFYHGAMDAMMLTGAGELLSGGEAVAQVGADVVDTGLTDMANAGVTDAVDTSVTSAVDTSAVDTGAVDTGATNASPAEPVDASPAQPPTTEPAPAEPAPTPAADASPAGGEGAPCSFTAATPVMTDHGEQAIGSLQIGETVYAYNPSTHQMDWEPILHVWIHSDDDLVDLTLTTTGTSTSQSATVTGDKLDTTTTTDAQQPLGWSIQQASNEVIHTNQKHPFLTTEKGFLPVGQITLGMHVVRADGTVGVVTGWKIVSGSSVMYNLEVAHDHTFTVGNGLWVVHNCGGRGAGAQARATQIKDTMVKKAGWWFRKETTVGVAHMEDATGGIQTFVTINETALAKWGEGVQSVLSPEETWIAGNVSGVRHAEEVLMDFARNSGRKIVGIGASNGFCGSCLERLLREVGQEFLGQ